MNIWTKKRWAGTSYDKKMKCTLYSVQWQCTMYTLHDANRIIIQLITQLLLFVCYIALYLSETWTEFRFRGIPCLYPWRCTLSVIILSMGKTCSTYKFCPCSNSDEQKIETKTKTFVNNKIKPKHLYLK